MKRNTQKRLTPQEVYGTVKEVCRDCGFCSNKKDSGLIGSNAFYCTRFFQQETPKARINAYNTACGKFKTKEEIQK